MYPTKATALFKYLDIVHRVFRNDTGTAWEAYDQHFRLRATHNLALDWRVPQWELWAQLVVPAPAAWGDRSDSGHLIARSRPEQTRALSGAQWVQGPRTCYEFNSLGKCT